MALGLAMAGISIVGSVVGGLMGMSAAKAAEAKAKEEKDKYEAKLTFLENNRQEIINPYEGAQDLSSSFSNPMANLSVATQAAEMQIEQADISLANTLDTIRATGVSAGGATALAQAALQSKKGVSASIEQQEVANEKLRAQGDQRLQERVAQEQQRMQANDAAGNIFEFQNQENRETAQLDRISAQLSGAQAQEAQAAADRTGAMTGMISGITSGLASGFGGMKGK